MKRNGYMKVILSSTTKEVNAQFIGSWKTKRNNILNTLNKYVLNFYIINSSNDKAITTISSQSKLDYKQLIEIIYKYGQEMIDEFDDATLKECYVIVRLK